MTTIGERIMFGKTLGQMQDGLAETLKPHIRTISTALYVIAGLVIMVLLALVTK